MIESFVVGTGARVKRALVVVGGGGVREDGAEGMGIEVRGRMGRGGLKGSFFLSSLLFLFGWVSLVQDSLGKVERGWEVGGDARVGG